MMPDGQHFQLSSYTASLAECQIKLDSESESEVTQSYLTLWDPMDWRRKWQPTPVFLPGNSHGRKLDSKLITKGGLLTLWTPSSGLYNFEVIK